MSIIHCPFLPKPPIFLGFSPPFWYFIWSPHPHHAASLCLPPVSVPKGAIALGHFCDKSFVCHLIPSGHHTARSKKFQPIFTDIDFLTDTDFNLGGGGPSIPQYWTVLDQGSWYQIPFETIGEFIFLQKHRIWPYTGINLWASDPDKDSFKPIHHLPINTDTDSNWFWDF